jgi:uncharacterized membrane protein YdjX (TVP38/TMEM64 family)
VIEEAGAWAPLVLIAVVSVTSFSITLPSSPFILLAGALFGPLTATLYATIGVYVGSSVAFFLARFFREPIVRMVGEHTEILARFQERVVFWVLFVTRAIPVLSFEVMSYAAGLTSMRYSQFLFANLGAVPGVFILATLGSLGGSIVFGEPSEWTSIAGALMVVVMLFVIPLAIDHYNPFGWKEKLLKRKE